MDMAQFTFTIKSFELPISIPRSYKLTLKAINEDGIAVQKPLDIYFEINAPFYLQWWFVGLDFSHCLGNLLVFPLANQ
jgi:hypothetical protein